MQARSALFDQTVAGPHTLLVRADVLSAGVVVASGLPVASGQVTGDRSQFARRSCTVVIGDPAYTPDGVSAPVLSPFGVAPFGTAPFGGGGGLVDVLAPYGNEVRLWRGAVTPAGPELICVGTFGIRSADWDDGGAFTGVTVTGLDRCKALAEARFPYPRTSPPQISAVEMVRALIAEVWPAVEVRVDPRLADVTLPQQTWQENRDQALTDIMASLGGELFCDPFGAFVLQPVPSPADGPVLTVTSGPGGVLVSARHSLTRDGVVNGVIARSSTTSGDAEPVVSDLIVDDDPTSPTYWGGTFGQVPGFYESSLLTSYAQANTAARGLLLNQIGAARTINYSALVNPAVEPGDVAAVVDPGTGVTERHLHDQVTIPLGVDGVMTAQTRSTVNQQVRLSPVLASASLS